MDCEHVTYHDIADVNAFKADLHKAGIEN